MVKSWPVVGQSIKGFALFVCGGNMSTTVQHPLARLLATPSKGTESRGGEEPSYDPRTQLQVQWVDIENHLEVLCSGKKTGDPDTRSATTARRISENVDSDDDTDDSGT
jgi:hypothetical protein